MLRPIQEGGDSRPVRPLQLIPHSWPFSPVFSNHAMTKARISFSSNVYSAINSGEML